MRPLQHWSPEHPVAHMIATGDRWFQAWMAQCSTPLVRLAKTTGIPVARLMAINAGDRVSRAEIDALARAWSVSARDLITSIGDAAEIVD